MNLTKRTIVGAERHGPYTRYTYSDGSFLVVENNPEPYEQQEDIGIVTKLIVATAIVLILLVFLLANAI